MASQNNIPNKPDPFWPEGVVPTHLSKTDKSDIMLVESYTGPLWRCEKCGSLADQSPTDKRYCIACVDKEAQNSAVAKRVNSGWMEQSEELGLAIFERQPEETDTEWRVWTAYRGHYPLKMPTWAELAAETGHAVATVIKAATKWSYRVRLVAWARVTDAEIQEKRIAAIKEMNSKQLTMSQTIQSKLQAAIDNIDPALLRPNEIVNLFKVATELERKITTYIDDTVESDAIAAKAKQVSLTKPEDLGEVVAILQKTGVLQGHTIGIEQTTRIIAKENE